MSFVDKVISNFVPGHIPESCKRMVKEKYQYSPDYGTLAQYEYQLLFIYDEHLPHHRHAPIMMGQQCKSAAFTEDFYSMWKKKLGRESYPIALEDRHSYLCPAAKIKGLLYKVETDLLFVLDKLKSNTVEFQRKRVGIVIPHRHIHWIKDRSVYEEIEGITLDHSPKILSEERIHRVPAWMYIGKREYWEDGLDAGYTTTPVKRYSRSRDGLEQYYYFGIDECKVNEE